jgi:hypothetical protein
MIIRNFTGRTAPVAAAVSEPILRLGPLHAPVASLSRAKIPAPRLPGLAAKTGLATVPRVNADDVIDQIKALPPEEQAKVIDFIEEVKAAQAKFADNTSFAAATEWVFKEHADLMRKLSQ